MITRTLQPTLFTTSPCGFCLLLAATAALLWPSILFAGGTPATGVIADQLLVSNGAGIGKSIGDFVSSNDGLDEPYKFFIEVGPDVDRLVVEIFDADILAGVVATEEANDRDLQRTDGSTDDDDTWALYSLYDPSGTRVPIQFGVGDATNPPSWDNSWTTLYDSQNATITTGDTFADNFSTQAYNRNDGTQNWAGDWTEEGETGTVGPTGGILQITNNELSISNAGDGPPFESTPGIYREVDLSSYTSAILSLDWSTGGVVEDEDSAIIEVSGDGGTTYVGLDIINQFISGASSGSRSYDISAFLASNTRIRIRIFDLFAQASPDEQFRVDNLQILANVGTSSTSPDDGHWELRMDVSSDIASRASEQDEMNAYGIRAHDGTSGAGGEEVHVYANSYVTFGLNMTDRTRTYQYYPYITEGCEFDLNDFDFDSGATDPDGVGGIDAPYGTWDLTSRLASFTDDEGGILSANNTWDNTVVTGWTSGNTADDYGIWDLDITISDFGVGNYADIYFGQEDAATPDPTAQPENDTFRIYFPTDANTAPAKPYFSQRVTHAGLGNGPNPPVMGSVSRFAVTLSITNPAGSIGDITFSATNLITANIPGDTVNARVRYQGPQTGFPTAGSIVSAPTIGSTVSDDIEWNPGTIAPGNTETLVYFFDLEPLVATDPLTIPVTGTYGTASGSRAVFIDETGASAATFNFGNLCGLDVISGSTATNTPVLVSSFTGYDTGRSTLLEWTTAAEAGTVQFELYRHDQAGKPVKVSEEPLLALLNASQGGTYRFLDEDAPPQKKHTYELLEIDAYGRSQRHGPFSVQAQAIATKPPQLYHSRPHRDSTSERQAKALFGALPGATVESGNQVKIITGEAGLYRVTAAELAPLFGLTTREMRTAIRSHQLELSHLDLPVAWLGRSVAGLSGQRITSIEFYAEAIDSIYTADNVYLLRLGQGLRMRKVQSPQSPTNGEPASFRDTLRSEENLRQLVLIPLNPESDIWFWDFVNPQNSKNFAFEVPAVADTLTTASLAIDLQGAQPGTHTLEVWLNGVFLDQVAVDGLERVHTTLSVDQSLLTSGTNTIELIGLTGGLVFVDGFDLEYDRLYQASGDRLLLRGDTNDQVALTGFGDAQIRVFDLSTPRRPGRHRARVVDQGTDGYGAIFEPKNASTNYLAVSEGGVFPPLALKVDQPSALHSQNHEVDYLVITTEDLLLPAQALATHREAGGLRTFVVRLDDIYDEFAHGLAEAPAINDFLAYAAENWKQAPRYVVLAGAGTYDYKDYLGFGGNLIPTRLRSTGKTLFPTDHPYADLIGDNGVPELILGRIPALTAMELATYVDKIIAYESLDRPDWGNEVVLASDNPDAAADFPLASSALAELIPAQYNSRTIALPDYADLEGARQDLFAAFDDGAVLLSFLGHGGVDRMAAEGLLTSADVPSLTNGEKLPVVVAVSCHIGLHGLPGFDALGEHLVLHPDGGAAAVWAPSWLSQHQQARFLGDRFLRNVFQNEERILGESILRALEAGADLGIDRHLLETYQLLGDPALEMRLTPEALPGGGGCNDSCGEGGV